MNSANIKILCDTIKLVKMKTNEAGTLMSASGGDSGGKHFGTVSQAPKEAFTALASVT